jgi:hypothetical protein
MRTQFHCLEKTRELIVPTFFIVVLGLLSSGLSSARPLDAESGMVEVTFENGTVDWSNGVIRAVGLGVPPDNAVNATHAHEMAKRAGRVVAYRNLLEIVEGIHVDSHTLVKNYMVESDTINTKVQGLVHGARVTEEKALPDGSYQVTVEMKLSGDFQRTVLPTREREPDPLKFTKQASLKNEPSADTIIVYTGLVIDAQGLDVQQTMTPKLLMEDGRVVYGAEWVDPEVAQEQTVVGYVNGIPNAKSHQRVIATPLVVKALRVDTANPSDLVISEADAQTLHMVPEHVAFLKKAKVLVVLK